MNAPLPLSTRDLATVELENSAELISDDDIDYAAMAAEDTTGSVTFRSCDYPSDKELMKAFRRFVFNCCREARDEAAG
jgi:hypothetical protein